jgi:hypothetical protein
MPDTSLVSTTELKLGSPLAFPCRTVVELPIEAIVDGTAPDPPPTTSVFWASIPEETSVPVPVKVNTPPLMPDVRPVPPCATVKFTPDVKSVPLVGSVRVVEAWAMSVIGKLPCVVNVSLSENPPTTVVRPVADAFTTTNLSAFPVMTGRSAKPA